MCLVVAITLAVPCNGPRGHRRVVAPGYQSCTIGGETQDVDLSVMRIPGVEEDPRGNLTRGCGCGGIEQEDCTYLPEIDSALICSTRTIRSPWINGDA